jgi:hypothetical protein
MLRVDWQNINIAKYMNQQKIDAIMQLNQRDAETDFQKG